MYLGNLQFHFILLLSTYSIIACASDENRWDEGGYDWSDEDRQILQKWPVTPQPRIPWLGDASLLAQVVEARPTPDAQVYRWYPRQSDAAASDTVAWWDYRVLLVFKNRIAFFLQRFPKDSLCEAAMHPNNTWYNETFAFHPHGWRVSRLMMCHSGWSIRLVNYRSWFTKNGGPVVINCHAGLNIAMELVRAMDLDRQYLNLGVPGKFHAIHHIPLIEYEHEDYQLIGSSFWGKDWSWAITIGREKGFQNKGGCPNLDEDIDEWVRVF